jgi:hypothetical protein
MRPRPTCACAKSDDARAWSRSRRAAEAGADTLVAPVTPALGRRGRCATFSYGCAPARPRSGRGFSRRPLAFAKTAGRGRPPTGLFRPPRSVPQVADEGVRPRLRRSPALRSSEVAWGERRDKRRVGFAVHSGLRRIRATMCPLATFLSATSPFVRSGGVCVARCDWRRRGLRLDQARRGTAMDGRPFSLSHGWRVENPRPKPDPTGRSHRTRPRSGILTLGSPQPGAPSDANPAGSSRPRSSKKKPAIGRFSYALRKAQASSRIFAFRRLLWRAALFLWIRPRAA